MHIMNLQENTCIDEIWFMVQTKFVIVYSLKWNYLILIYISVSSVTVNSTSTPDESYNVGWKLLISMFSPWSFNATRLSTDMSQVGVAIFSPFEPIFYHFTFSCFPFIFTLSVEYIGRNVYGLTLKIRYSKFPWIIREQRK